MTQLRPGGGDGDGAPGYVIQDGGLFPHFTVERNIALVPRIEGWDQPRIQARVRELLSIVGLDASLASRYPKASASVWEWRAPSRPIRQF